MLNTLKTYYTYSVFPRCGIFDIIIAFLKIGKNMFRVFPQINRKQKNHTSSKASGSCKSNTVSKDRSLSQTASPFKADINTVNAVWNEIHFKGITQNYNHSGFDFIF